MEAAASKWNLSIYNEISFDYTLLFFDCCIGSLDSTVDIELLDHDNDSSTVFLDGTHGKALI